MIKLQDFARQQGVTDRAIQKHLKKYAEEFEGLYQRKGPNGTWLTEEACELLRSKMITPPPPTVFDEDPRVKKLEARIEELEKLLAFSQQTLANAQSQVAELQGARAQLEAAEKEKTLLEGFIRDAKTEINTLNAENADLRRENVEKDKTLEDERKIAQKANVELTEALRRKEDELRAEMDYVLALEAYRDLSWLKRIRTPKPTRAEKEQER